jgi:glyoxylase-like metal-dependent hydrolase (beta-lactamase superfamily II)
MRFDVGGWRVDILIQGFPGKATEHGGLGWSTVALLRGHGRIAVLDGGGFGMRRPLMEGLRKQGVGPNEVTDLVLSHAHHDHSVNWPLFRGARIHLGRKELAWALGVPWGETPVDEPSIAALSRWPTLRLLDEHDEVLPGITCRLGPGHTPGHLVFTIRGEEHDLILLQDAVKNRVELTTRQTDMTYDPAVSRATVEMVWDMIRARPGSILVPGHDVPMVVENGVPRALSRQTAGIKAWLGDTLQDMTHIPLAPAG